MRTEPTTPYRDPTSYLNNFEWVDGAIAELVKGQYIMGVREKPYLSSPLSVVENSSGKKRLEVNMRQCKQVSIEEEFQIRGLACSHDAVRAR